MQCFKCLYVVRVVATPPDNDAIRNRRQYDFEIKVEKSRFNFLEKFLFRSERCFDQVSLWSMMTPSNLVWCTHEIVVEPIVMRGCGPMKEPLCNSIASHFVECGVRELVTHHSLSSLSALLRRLQASSTVEPVQ